MPSNSSSNKKREAITLAIVFAGVLSISALAVYSIAGLRQATGLRPTELPVDTVRQPAERSSPSPHPTDDENFIDRLFGSRQSQITSGPWVENVGQTSSRLLLAALLGSALALRPRKRIVGVRRNPYVAQTQILLAIVAAALMIIVGDNAARAFGIFAAVSLVRFRTNIRDPKEITVLLISLALGLAAGVGRWDLALILAAFVLCVLWLLEWREPQLVFRSLEMKITSTNVASTKRALREVFKKHGFESELRAVDRNATEESPGTIIYSVDVTPSVTTDQLSEEIFSFEKHNIESIEWDQKKSFSYLYQ